MSDQPVVYELPVLPLKNAVLFPYLLMPLSAGRAGSVAAVEAALATESKEVLVFTQRDADVDSPLQGDLYPIGTKAVIRKMSRSEGHLELLVLGMERVTLVKLDTSEPFLKARVTPLPLPEDKSSEIEALQGALIELAGEALSLAQPNAPQELRGLLAANEDPLRLAFVLSSMFNLDAEKAQALLEAPTRAEALRLVHRYLTHEVQVLELRNKITTEARTEMNKEQRDYLLRQQMRAIQQELGEKGGEQAEAEQLRERLEKADLPEDILKEATRELNRLEKLPPGAPDYNVIRTYLDYVLELPWRKSTEDSLDIAKARRVLDEDHYGLKDVKERILEHLACSEAESQRQGADPVLRGTSRSWKNFAGPIHRAGAQPEVRALEPGRHARRSGIARPSPHLYRRDAGPCGASHAARGSEQSRADAGRSR